MTDTAKPFTGRKFLFIMIAAFGVIITVNLTLAFNAVRTFPGVETKNSYVASQSFDARRTAQSALGWSIHADAQDGMVHLAITDKAGKPVRVAKLDATLGRATHVKDDQAPEFVFRNGVYEAPATLGAGNWNIRMKAIAADGTPFEQRVILHVK
ncbi:FixH family protein [Nereida sp. MMG025]|uniref:FixH family protein n=1 Tax=Nereida sp. MMG025 TaxID=2909981 RepID=UPI001F1A8825|nr:FixH family protein [Nereida sp. MMG025]MCF6446127.1 FixH family protein [Nereida sp. MMG025]